MAGRKNKWIETSETFTADGPYGRAIVYKNHEHIKDEDYKYEHFKYSKVPHKYVVYDNTHKIVREGTLGTFHSARLMAGQLILGYDRLAPRSKNAAYINSKVEPETLKLSHVDSAQIMAVLERIATALENISAFSNKSL